MNKLLLLLISALPFVFWTSACAEDSEPELTEEIAAPEARATTDAPDAGEEPELDEQAREDYIEANVENFATRVFPEMAETTWEIEEVDHLGVYSVARAEPETPISGYSTLEFIFGFGEDHAVPDLGAYALLPDGSWNLLYGEDPLDLHP